jgi:hypothetical protein
MTTIVATHLRHGPDSKALVAASGIHRKQTSVLDFYHIGRRAVTDQSVYKRVEYINKHQVSMEFALGAPTTNVSSSKFSSQLMAAEERRKFLSRTVTVVMG